MWSGRLACPARTVFGRRDARPTKSRRGTGRAFAESVEQVAVGGGGCGAVAAVAVAALRVGHRAAAAPLAVSRVAEAQASQGFVQLALAGRILLGCLLQCIPA